MKLLFLGSGDRVPSCRFRVLQLVPHLRAAGHRCTVACSFPQKYDSLEWLGFRPSQWLKRAVRYAHLWRTRVARYDAVILERELFHDPTWDMERRFRKAAGTLVLDVDDAVFLNHPEKFPHLVEMSDLVIAGNRHLADWLAPLSDRVVVIPTCVDLDAYQPRPAACAANRPVIGWMGTAGNVAYLDVAVPALSSLARRYDFELRVIAGDRGVLDRLPLDGVDVRFVRWNPATEAIDIQDFDIGLMPLTDDDWSRYKCGLKLLQYMAVGVPGVASPVGVNAEIIESGKNGFLARTPEEWESSLSRLLADAQLRRDLGQAARKTVEDRYSIAANLPRWIAAVEETIQRER